MATRKTPETLTAVERAATLATKDRGSLPPLSLSPRPSTTRTEARNAAVESQARANLGQIVGRSSRPMAPPTPSLDPKADLDDSFSILPIGEIEPYEHNPRTGTNPKYDEIRDSILADGITNPITVTRKPGAAKYHPYGGGNTRLAIAKELQANGDSRFNTVRVIVKAWPGDANVITAHLAENENRGDISFWEKARGVAAFKKAYEDEHNVVLSTGDLARELKAHGVSFGLKVIQNFAFAVEHLGSIGPWLKAKEVNEVLRPAVTGVLALASKFDVKSTTHIEPVLLKHRDEMLALITYNKDVEEVERKPVEIDTGTLVTDLQEALAAAIGTAPDVVPLMLSALEANSRISADELKAIKVRKPQEAMATQGSGASAAPGPQRSLTGMLAGLPPTQQSPITSAPSTDSQSKAPSTPSPANAASTTQQNALQPQTQPGARNPGLPEGVSVDDPTATVLSLVLDISDVALLHDCILHVKDMPFGYCMDLPKQLDKLGEEQLQEGRVQVRAAAWKFLASLSGQLDPQWITYVSEDASNWTRFAKAGPTAFRQNYERALRGVTAPSGDPAMLLAEVYLMFSQPELSQLTISLLHAMEQLRKDHPQRFVRTVTPDPDLPQ